MTSQQLADAALPIDRALRAATRRGDREGVAYHARELEALFMAWNLSDMSGN